MQPEFKWLKMAYDAKMKTLDNYEDKQAFKAYAKGIAMKWHAEMTTWQPEPKADSLEQVFDIVEDALTGPLPDTLKPHAVPDEYLPESEDKPKKEG